MFNKIDNKLNKFRPCFTQARTFQWFVIVIIGFIVRLDHQGISSIVRWLYLEPGSYELLCHFFRSSSWNLDAVLACWTQIAVSSCPILTINGRAVLIGDGIKISKEASRMPGVKRLHQDSDNSGKGEKIRGHHFGFVGLLIGSLSKLYCLPLEGRLHEGVDHLPSDSEGNNGQKETIVTRMAKLVVKAAKTAGLKCYVTLDAYFSTGPAFKIFKESVDDNGEQIVHLITRAKSNYVAYLNWQADESEPYQEEDKFVLAELCNNDALFLDNSVEVTINGKKKTLQYFCNDMLWNPVDALLRFVLIRDGQAHFILMCSDLNMAPEDIIKLYLQRSKIEVMFKGLKYIIGGFCYRFWSKAQPKMKSGKKAKAPDVSSMSKADLETTAQTVEAIERFINLAGIALGLLQYLALQYPSQIWDEYCGWLRTYSSDIPSEKVVQSVIQATFFASLRKVPKTGTLQIVRRKNFKRLASLGP